MMKMNFAKLMIFSEFRIFMSAEHPKKNENDRDTYKESGDIWRFFLFKILEQKNLGKLRRLPTFEPLK